MQSKNKLKAREPKQCLLSFTYSLQTTKNSQKDAEF